MHYSPLPSSWFPASQSLFVKRLILSVYLERSRCAQINRPLGKTRGRAGTRAEKAVWLHADFLLPVLDSCLDCVLVVLAHSILNIPNDNISTFFYSMRYNCIKSPFPRRELTQITFKILLIIIFPLKQRI